MEIDLGENSDLNEKSDYPTGGWLNQNHDLLQGMGLEKIDPVKIPDEYVVDDIFSPS